MALLPVRPVALSPGVCLRERGDIIVSVLVVLKSPFVDVEDFDRVVSAGAGELDPGALLLALAASISLSVRPLVVSTCSAGPGPPAEPLDSQRVALSERTSDVGKQIQHKHSLVLYHLSRQIHNSSRELEDPSDTETS